MYSRARWDFKDSGAASCPNELGQVVLVLEFLGSLTGRGAAIVALHHTGVVLWVAVDGGIMIIDGIVVVVGAVVDSVLAVDNVGGNAVLVEAVLADLVVAFVVVAGVGTKLLAVGMGLAARGGVGEASQCVPIIFFKLFRHILKMESENGRCQSMTSMQE